MGWIESDLRGMGSSVPTLLLKAICAAVLSGILLAGLWPFHSPKNDVSWLNRGNGLLLGKYGSIVSAGTFETNRSQTDSSCSIEVWLEPDRVNASGTILAFYWTASPIAPYAAQPPSVPVISGNSTCRQPEMRFSAMTRPSTMIVC